MTSPPALSVSEDRVAASGISYRDSAPGQTSRPVVVLLHGIGSGAESWDKQFEAMGAEYRLLAWDAPGYGDSTGLAAPGPLAADYAEALHGLIQALDLPCFILVGHSLGALIAAAYARRHGDRLRGLFLADPAEGYGMADEETRNRMVTSRLDLLAELGPEGMAATRAANLLSDQASPDDINRVRRVMAQIHPAGYGQAVRMLAAGRLLDDLRQVGLPGHVVCGDQDRITPPDMARRAAAALNAPCTEIADAGHASYIDRPETFNALLGAFINETIS